MRTKCPDCRTALVPSPFNRKGETEGYMCGNHDCRNGEIYYPDEDPEYICKYCGRPSHVDPADQVRPSDYCTESDHGFN